MHSKHCQAGMHHSRQHGPQLASRGASAASAQRPRGQPVPPSPNTPTGDGVGRGGAKQTSHLAPPAGSRRLLVLPGTCVSDLPGQGAAKAVSRWHSRTMGTCRGAARVRPSTANVNTQQHGRLHTFSAYRDMAWSALASRPRRWGTVVPSESVSVRL